MIKNLNRSLFPVSGSLFLITVFLLFNSISYANEKASQCTGSDVVVKFSNIDDYYMACRSVNELMDVAQKIGLNEDLNISILFVDSLSINITGKSLAVFNPNTMKIEVLSIAASQKNFGDEAVLGLQMDKELHRSVITHELAHALFWQNMKKTIIAREIHEYFAYVIQLSLLDPSHRKEIIAANDVPAFLDRSEMTEEYYLLNPTRFAVKSYLHFVNRNNDWPSLLRLFKE